MKKFQTLILLIFLCLCANICVAQTGITNESIDNIIKYTCKFSNWQGYDYYTNDSSRAEILDKIDSLILSDVRITEFPKVILEMKNLKYLSITGRVEIYNNKGILSGINSISNISEIKKLKNLEYLELNYCGLDTFPLEICELTNLKHLILIGISDYVQISVIPQDITKLKNLTEINFSNNNINIFPKVICKLQNLTILNLSNNQIRAIPKEIINLKNLKELYLETYWKYNLKPISEDYKFGNLTKLDLSGWQFENFNFLEQFSDLTYLKLSKMYLSELPEQILKFKKLETLDLSFSNITEIPEEIANLKNLSFLNLRGYNKLDIESVFKAFENYERKINISSDNNEEYLDSSKLLILLPSINLKSFPENLTEIKNLTNLNLYGGFSYPDFDYSSVFKAIKNFKKEIWISNIYSTQLQSYSCMRPGEYSYNINNDSSKLLIILPLYDSIPKEIGEVKSITNIDLSGNVIPIELFNLQNLKILNLQSCNLKTIPVEIKNLKNLDTLNITNNGITSIPSELCSYLSSIKKLYCDSQVSLLCNPELITPLYLAYKNLDSLPFSVSNFTNITQINFYYNNFVEIPSEICNLKSANYLNFSHNQLTSIPEEISNLTNLTELDLSINQITILTNKIGKLENLQKLNLSNNKITEIPIEFDCLENLEDLNISNNKITKIDSNILKLPNLNQLHLTGNDSLDIYDFFENLKGVKKQKSFNGYLNWNTDLIINFPKINFIPENIGNITNLSYIDFSSDSIKYIPKEIGNLKNLKGLTLKNNQIDSLPKEIGNLSNLINIILTNNKISVLPSEIGKLNRLEYIELFNPKLK